MTKTLQNQLALSASMVVALAIFLALPAITSASVEKTDGFVCPVIKTDAVLNSPKGMEIGEGHYTIVGPDVSVPLHATNADGDGSPGGEHSAPGDSDYTAVWAGQ